MKEKDLKLFDKAIHDVKYLMQAIANERKEHHKKIDILMKKHDKKINKELKDAKEVLAGLYELFLDLSTEGDNNE